MKNLIATVLAVTFLAGCCGARQPSSSRGGNEPVKVIDYEKCLDAEKMGGGDTFYDRCGKLRQEIKHAD